jgi:uncharacterized protein (DUF2164 family)
VSAREVIARDMKAKISEHLEDYLQREINLLRQVLPANEVALISLEIGMTVLTAALMIAIQCRREGVDSSEFFDQALQTITLAIAAKRDANLAALAAVEAQRASAS